VNNNRLRQKAATRESEEEGWNIKRKLLNSMNPSQLTSSQTRREMRRVKVAGVPRGLKARKKVRKKRLYQEEKPAEGGRFPKTTGPEDSEQRTACSSRSPETRTQLSRGKSPPPETAQGEDTKSPQKSRRAGSKGPAQRKILTSRINRSTQLHTDQASERSDIREKTAAAVASSTLVIVVLNGRNPA